MKRKLSLSLALLAVLLIVTVTLAQSDYDLSWFKVVGGGGETSGGSYTLVGAIGQPEAGAMSGGAAQLSWLYLPLISR